MTKPMGIYDILQKHKMDYKDLTDLMVELTGCVDFNGERIINQLDEIYDDDEYKRDFRPARPGVFVVRQTQPSDYYQEKTIAVFDNKEQAEKLSRALNQEYGHGVKFDENWDFVDFDESYDYDDQHYYDWEYQEINPALSIFGVDE